MVNQHTQQIIDSSNLVLPFNGIKSSILDSSEILQLSKKTWLKKGHFFRTLGGGLESSLKICEFWFSFLKHVEFSKNSSEN